MCVKDALMLAETAETGDQFEGTVLDGVVTRSFVWGESVYWMARVS